MGHNNDISTFVGKDLFAIAFTISCSGYSKTGTDQMEHMWYSK